MDAFGFTGAVIYSSNRLIIEDVNDAQIDDSQPPSRRTSLPCQGRRRQEASS